MNASQVTSARSRPALPPAVPLLAGVVVLIIVGALAVHEALRPRWLGLTLESDGPSGEARIVATRGPSQTLPAPSVLEAIAVDDQRLNVTAAELIDEPDLIDAFSQMATFFATQGALTSLLDAPEVTLHLRHPDGSRGEHRVSPQKRPVNALPFAFWFQLGVGVLSALVGLWVLVLSPKDWSARMFALMNATFPLATMTAAIYSTRELALDGVAFQRLSALNHLGSLTFGAALVGLFLQHPRRLVAPRHLGWGFGVALLWWVADAWRLVPDQNWGIRAGILVEMLAVLALAAVQWRISRGDPVARSSLRWFGLSVIVGCSLFLTTVIGVSMIGQLPAIPQAYAFGFFLLMDVGFGLGLRRHALLGLDEWAFRILLWVGSALVLVMLDVLLIVALRTHPAVSLSLALLVCGFLYLPVRNWLWSKTVLGRRVDEGELFQGVLAVAFAVSASTRTRLWTELLRRVFDATEVQVADDVDRVRIERQGLDLVLPAVASLPAARVSYPWRGRGLFSPRQARLGANLVELMAHAGNTRDAFQRGVLEERHRIARDLHDHLGARLLSGLYEEDPDETRETLRHALSDMRSVVHELSGRRLTLPDALGELRHETARRIEAAGLVLDWPVELSLPALVPDDAVLRHLTAMLRELTSNTIRHAGANRLQVRVRLEGDVLHLEVRDDGRGLSGSTPGNGLGNLERRAGEVGGSVRFFDATPGTGVELRIPLIRRDSEVDAA